MAEKLEYKDIPYFNDTKLSDSIKFDLEGLGAQIRDTLIHVRPNEPPTWAIAEEVADAIIELLIERGIVWR